MDRLYVQRIEDTEKYLETKTTWQGFVGGKKGDSVKKKKKGKLGEIESVPNCGAFHTKRLLALIVKEVVRQGCTRW